MARPPAPPHEPRLARVGAMVGDPARSRMLAYLLNGHFASAGELAEAASVSASTASGHLAQLLANGLLACEQRGRHRYFRLADAEVAHALEALALLAERGPHDKAWSAPARQRLRYARRCYGHLAGTLGVALYDTLLANACLHSGPRGLHLTPQGQAWLARIGCTPRPARAGARFAYPCLDWSERRDHLAGSLATDLLEHFVAQGWLAPDAVHRGLALTPRGRQQLLPELSPLCPAAGGSINAAVPPQA
ncbi:MAG: ArsR/SmtB family transcription factor [Pseudomonadota bacterium]